MKFYSPLDGMLVHHRVAPSIKFAGFIYTTAWREALKGLRILSKNTKKCSWLGLEPWTAQWGVTHTSHQATAPPSEVGMQMYISPGIGLASYPVEK